MDNWSPLEDDVLLKGTLTVLVRRRNGRPCPGKRVSLRGCGFVWGGTSAVTDQNGTASVEAPLGMVEVRVGGVSEEAWVAVDLETLVEITLG